MTLEDFFTLTEMRDGLSNLARIEELISMIQNLNNCVTSNLGDSVRQWSTVVNVLAATSNKDCLNQFLQLNGLSFLNRWLQDALKLSSDASKTVAEELISSLLSFFERAPIDYNASGIGITLKLLLDHKSGPINEKVKSLYDKWNHARNDYLSIHNEDQCGSGQDQPETSQSVKTSENSVPVIYPVIDVSPSTEGIKEGKSQPESAGAECLVTNVTRCLDSPSCESTKEKVQISNQVLSTSTNPLADMNSSSSNIVSNPCQDSLLVTENSSACVEVGQSSTATCSKLCQEGPEDEQHDALKVPNDVPDDANKMDIDVRENKDCGSNQTEIFSNSSSYFFSASITSLVTAAEQTTSSKLDSSNSICVADGMDDKLKSGSFDHQKCLTTEGSSPTANFRSHSHNVASTATIISNSGDFPVSSQQGEATSNAVKDPAVEVKHKTRKDRFVTSTDFLKVVGNKTKEEANQKSDLALESLDDALEVARQVAIAVEREVVDYREPCCSSPEVNSIETRGSHNPGSEGKQDEPVTEEVGPNSPSSDKDHSGTSSPDKGSEITQNLSSDPELSEKDIDSAKPGTPSDSVGTSIVERCIFDLNSDICSDDPECLLKPIMKMPINVSAPVAVIASSKGAPGLPVTLCFGGEMGWKGSAATSAFRPASPRRTPDAEKKFSGLKQKSNALEIDLNVTEGSDEVADEPRLQEKLLASCSLPSGDSTAEVSSQTEKLNLDLNQLGNDDNSSTYPLLSWKLNSQNGEPSRRNFDLNDDPSLLDGGGSYNFSVLSATKVSESYGGSAPHDPVIKIMGSKIAIETKDNASTQDLQYFLPNGTKMEPLTCTLLPCTSMQTATFGYTGFPPSYYPPPRSISSYMVDSRGATTFMPHISGGSGGSSLQAGRPPFLFGPTGMPSNVAVFGSSQPDFDLNSGVTLMEGGTRDGGSFKQFLRQGHSSWKEEQTNPSVQPSSSTTALKRKEADSGWEPFTHGYKRMTSWQ